MATISGIDAPPTAVTVLDVAREAGVSPSTVSRILNGTARVTSDKRSAVEEAIRKLDFRPNLFARSLKTGTTMTVGILTQDVESPFYGRAMKGIEAGLAGTGYAPIMVSGHWNAAEEAERVRLLMARRIDGLVILTGHLDDRQIAEFARHQPIVVTGRQLDAPQVRAFTLDQEAGGHLATCHLLSLGHRRIAHIAGPSDHTDATDRRAGYERALREAGIAPAPELVVQGDFLENGGLLAMNRLLAGSLLLAITGAVFAALEAQQVDAVLAENGSGGVPAADRGELDGLLAGSASAKAELAGLPSPVASSIHDGAAEAFSYALGHSMWVLVAVGLAGTVLTWWLLAGQTTGSAAVADAEGPVPAADQHHYAQHRRPH